MEAIQLNKNSDMEKNIILYLKWSLMKKKNKVIDLPCYTNPVTQEYFRKEIRKAAINCHLGREITSEL